MAEAGCMKKPPRTEPAPEPGPAAAGVPPPQEPEELLRLRRLVEAANTGDAAAIADLRLYLDENPHVWKHVGDLGKVARQSWISLIARDDVLAVEALQRQLAQLAADLVGDDPGPIDRLLADQILASWLEVNHLHGVVADAKGGNATTQKLLLQRLESAQRRHLMAMKQFAVVRKLLPRDFPLRVFDEEVA
jgi:hypothetical protein